MFSGPDVPREHFPSPGKLLRQVMREDIFMKQNLRLDTLLLRGYQQGKALGDARKYLFL